MAVGISMPYCTKYSRICSAKSVPASLGTDSFGSSELDIDEPLRSVTKPDSVPRPERLQPKQNHPPSE